MVIKMPGKDREQTKKGKILENKDSTQERENRETKQKGKSPNSVFIFRLNNN